MKIYGSGRTLFVALLLFSLGSVKGKTEIAMPTSDRANELLEMARTANRQKDISKAILHYQKVIGLCPTSLDAWHELGAIRYEQGDYKEALHCYRKALALNPDSAPLHYNIGLCLKRQENIDEASNEFEQAITLQPNSVRSYLNYALLLKKKEKIAEAIAVLQEGIVHVPHDADLHRTLGIIYREQDRFELAVEEFRCAVQFAPGDPTMLLELANSLSMMDQLDEALDLYRQAFELNNSLNNALYNIGYVLKRKGYVDQAIEVLNKVIEREPDNAQAHFSLGLSYLMRGATSEDWLNGWLEYEWRWAAYNEVKPRYQNKPLWQGEDISGKTILLIAEQGLGDTFQFIRYAMVLKEQGARIILLSQKPLKTFMKVAVDYVDDVVVVGDPMPQFDVQISLMSLPLVFKTAEKTVPVRIPYLKADPALVTYWRDRLSSDKKIKIGLCWQGNANYRTQALRQVVSAKSFEAKRLAQLAVVADCSFYSLQKMNGTDQLDSLPDSITIHDFGSDLDEEHGRFMDTAAIIANLDLVITADTSIAHLAAALGIRTWVLLPTPADWRWMLVREDTPWYPNIRLFRQQTIGDWDGLFQNVVDALHELVKGQRVGDDCLELVTPPQKVARKGTEIEQNAAEQAPSGGVSATVGEETATLLALPLAEFLDKFTLFAVREGSLEQSVSLSDDDRRELVRSYQVYEQQYPQVRSFTHGLYAVNCYLVEVLNSLNDGVQKLEKDETEAKIKRLNRAQKLKRLIKDEITSLVR